MVFGSGLLAAGYRPMRKLGTWAYLSYCTWIWNMGKVRGVRETPPTLAMDDLLIIVVSKRSTPLSQG